jgi:hypothetical protein
MLRGNPTDGQAFCVHHKLDVCIEVQALPLLGAG